MSHTPGPWSVSPGLNPGLEGDGGKKSIVIFGDVAGDEECGVLGNTPEQQQANARLIAAAPELLAAVQAAECFISEFSGPKTDKLKGTIAAAIAKATGE